MQLNRSDVAVLLSAGVALALTPLMELAPRLWPIRFYLVQWRFQLEVGAIGAVPLLLLGGLLAFLGLRETERSSLLRILGVLAAVASVVLLATTGMLALDGAQLRQLAPADARGPFRNNLLTTGVRGVAGTIALAMLAVGAWRASRRVELAPARGRRGRDDGDRQAGGDELLLMQTGTE